MNSLEEVFHDVSYYPEKSLEVCNSFFFSFRKGLGKRYFILIFLVKLLSYMVPMIPKSGIQSKNEINFRSVSPLFTFLLCFELRSCTIQFWKEPLCTMDQIIGVSQLCRFLT